MVVGVEQIDYKDMEMLKDFIGENGKIMLVCLMGMKVYYQCQLDMVIKCVCFFVLLLYIDQYKV